MIRKLLIILLLFLGLFTQPSIAQDILKINNINFDNSDTVIFLGTSGIDNYTPLSVTKGSLTNPDRVYFDIKDAMITQSNAEFKFSNSAMDSLKIAQFSSNPAIVRIVITTNNQIDPQKIKVFKHNNNLIIKLKDDTPIQDYLTQIYRESKNSPYDILEEASVSAIQVSNAPTEQPNKKNKQKTKNNDLFNQIQQAFNDTTSQLSPGAISYEEISKSINTPPQTQTASTNKEKKLRSRYFVESADIRNGNILINGVGTVNIDKLSYESSPSQVILDLANTILSRDLRGKQIPITSVESVKLNQIGQNLARITINTPSPQKYKPIYSFDLQNLLIGHEDRMSGIKLFNTTTEISDFTVEEQNREQETVTVDFTNPVVHSIKRDGTKLELTLYNASYINIEKFKAAIRNTQLAESKVERLPYQGIRISSNIKNEAKLDFYENLNATEIKFTIKTQAPAPEVTKRIEKLPCAIPQENKSGLKTIVLDAGHGGSDTGALRNGIAEKDITLDIARKTAAILTNRGYHVEMTRWNDTTVSLQERVEFSNAKNTDAFVSIHINASTTPSAHGIETHYYTDQGYEIAKTIHKSIISKIPETDRGLLKSRFYVINHTAAPSTLLELGFISNDRERSLLLNEERKRKFAEAIADGIVSFVNSR